MQEKDVLSKISEDFLEQTPAADIPQLRAFCAFADKWLAKRGVVGLGYVSSGFALRFANGDQFLLHTPVTGQEVPSPQSAISITGVDALISKPILGDSRSVAITGN